MEMAYKSSEAVRGSKASPPHKEHNAKGSAINPYGARDAKAALLARMKAAAEAAKKSAA